MQLEIVTPDRSVVIGQAVEVVVPGLVGELDVLPGHAPLFTLLGTGVMSFRAEGKEVKLMVSGGFMEVEGDRVILMCDQAALSTDVKVDDDKASVQSLEAKLKSLGAVAPTDKEFSHVKAEIERATARLSLR
jgi:F-type H+-transporting ATPase subunit epsilon